LFKLAMDIIPIQASSVPCERVFSSGKETMASRRRRISPKLMEELQILKFSIRRANPLNFTEGLKWKDEVRELEKIGRSLPPEDAEEYQRELEEGEGDSDLGDMEEEVIESSETEESDADSSDNE
jgi:hypothetical protein